jgi:hypothetical protein
MDMTYLAIQHQLPAGNIIHNQFTLYLHFPAKVYAAQLSEPLERVELDWIFFLTMHNGTSPTNMLSFYH